MLTHTLVSLCEGAMDADRAGQAGRRPWFPLLPVVALWYTDAGGRHLEEEEHSVSNSGTNIVVGEETNILSYKYMYVIFFPGRANGGACPMLILRKGYVTLISTLMSIHSTTTSGVLY